jgi:hypothetical protein
MNNDECQEVFDTLVKMLNDQGLGWVVAQVQEQIRLGKTVEKEIKTLREAKHSPSIFELDEYRKQLKTGPLATFPVPVEYNSKERLQLLIDAIEQAVVNTAQMEENFTSFFEKELPHLSDIRFFSEDGTLSPREINRQSAVVRNDQAIKLKQLLEDLRQEI